MCTVLCGGNIDASTLTRVVDRGLIAEGRICRFTVIVADRPGGMAEMLQIIADVSTHLRLNLRHISYLHLARIVYFLITFFACLS